MTSEKSHSHSSSKDVHNESPMQARVYELMKVMIQEGRIRSGEKLLEVHVARAFGVSRSPARHALEALKAGRFVHSAEGRGYIVSGKTGATEASGLAKLEDVAIQPVARWERVHAELEMQVCKRVLHHPIRVVEERVAEHFQVSRTVARDALARLHSAGVVSKDRQGRWVASRITAGRIRDLYELRWTLEPLALVQSARNVGYEAIALMKSKLALAITNVEVLPSEIHSQIEHDLHIELLNSCPNSEINIALERTHLLLISNPYFFNMYIGIPRETLKVSLEQHLHIFDKLLLEDWQGAAHLLKVHLQDSCQVWLQRFENIRDQPQSAMPVYLSKIDISDVHDINSVDGSGNVA